MAQANLGMLALEQDRPADAIQPPPDTVAGTSGHYLQGIATLGERLVLVLDVAEVVRAPDGVPQPADSAAG